MDGQDRDKVLVPTQCESPANRNGTGAGKDTSALDVNHGATRTPVFITSSLEEGSPELDK